MKGRILPKGYTRSRSYGGYHSSKRVDYLELCRQLLPAAPCNADQDETAALETPAPTPVRCPACNAEMAWKKQRTRNAPADALTCGVSAVQFGCQRVAGERCRPDGRPGEAQRFWPCQRERSCCSRSSYCYARQPFRLATRRSPRWEAAASSFAR